MKQIVAILLFSSAISLIAQKDNSMSYGIQWGLHGNKSEFTGGIHEANSRFQINPYGGVALDFIARYDHNNRWMVTSGLGISQYGFEFALTENYSLIDNQRKYSAVRSDFAMITVPMMIYYKFNPNCLNKKWLLGAGVVAAATGAKEENKSLSPGTEGITDPKYLNSVSKSNGLSTLMLRFSVAREKTLKCGGLLQIAFLCNYGLSELASAKVQYTAEGQEYTHEFLNKGNFAGVRFAYFFNCSKTKTPQLK